ncbi:hypothetical protein INR49_030502 [Caranx melampygus]|nr:hypothetical protein INR49_030502 [Caranx melampygus]
MSPFIHKTKSREAAVNPALTLNTGRSQSLSNFQAFISFLQEEITCPVVEVERAVDRGGEKGA